MTNSCPTCGYKKIEFDRHFKEDGRDVYKFHCPLCKTRFTEFYRSKDMKFTMRLTHIAVPIR